jgi:NTE family protein
MINQSISLCLSGGAARGAFTLGVLDILEKENINIQRYSGSSIGGIIAASHASGVSAKEQLKIFKSKALQETIKFNYFRFGVFYLDTKHSVLDDLLPIKYIENLEKKVFISTYDIKNKQLNYHDHGDAKQLCAATSALIPLFKPITTPTQKLIDGGLVDNLPIKPLLDFEDEILSINLIHPKKTNIRKKWFNKIEANLSLSSHVIGSKELKNYSMWTFKDLENLFLLGQKQASKYLENVICCA